MEAWKCYLCHSEDAHNKPLDLNAGVKNHSGIENPAVDQSTECSSYDLRLDSAPAASNSYSRQSTKDKRKKSRQQLKVKTKTRKRADSGAKISVKVHNRPKRPAISSSSGSSKTVNLVENSPTSLPLSSGIWIHIKKSNKEPISNGNKKSLLAAIQNISESSAGCVVKDKSYDNPENSEQPSLGKQHDAKMSATTSSTSEAALTHEAPTISQDRQNLNKTSQAINAILLSSQEDGIPARMRIAQSSVNGESEATAWNDFGQGLLYLHCEDGCSVHLIFKVAGHSFLKIPVRPEPQNPPVVRFEFPSLIIAVPCSESVWTKHAFTFLQSELCSRLTSVLYVMNRVWNFQNLIATAPDINCPNHPTYIQENLVNYIKSIQNRPDFRAYCNAIQNAMRSQPIFE